MDCISKKAVLNELETKQDVETYLNGFEAEINYFKCLKLLKLMEFKAKKQKKSLLLTATHRSKRLNWAKAHKSWTSNNLRHMMVFFDETKISICV